MAARDDERVPVSDSELIADREHARGLLDGVVSELGTTERAVWLELGR